MKSSSVFLQLPGESTEIVYRMQMENVPYKGAAQITIVPRNLTKGFPT